MKRYKSYFKYVLLHKWYVLVAMCRLGGSVRQALLHDLSKFRPSEFVIYAKTFFTAEGKRSYAKYPSFDEAWNHHQKRNKHHWEYWIVIKKDSFVPLDIPDEYLTEMVADMLAVSRLNNGYWGVREYYTQNMDKFLMTEYTRMRLEFIIKDASKKFGLEV